MNDDPVEIIDRDGDHAETQVSAPGEAAGPLAELESLIGELKSQVGALRENELDAAALELRLRELNDLATRAASVLDASTR
ncbi:MAG: hypothetical protein HY827_02165 [Actinobacteria bacterium]|nr:hypothetical protein [Actinomycetota bacterium]